MTAVSVAGTMLPRMSGGDSGRQMVDGRFRLDARLGGGGMGLVWRATDVVLHRSVAVKEVRPPDPDLAEYDPESARQLRERVLREARALARIDHPNVVTIHHVVDGGPGTFPWIVMELVTGGSFADRLAAGPMDPVSAARIGLDVLSALDAAHAAGIEHRDVKPANVLLRPDGRAVLTDFGIAAIREATTLTATGSIIGTADYMAPERISGKGGGPAADLWSLAMMLYTAVEGRHPLHRGTTLATLAAVLSEEVPPPVRAGALGDVLMRVLVKEPGGRPGAGVVRGLLEGVVSGEVAGPEHAGDSGATSYRLSPPGTDGGATGHPVSPHTTVAPGFGGMQAPSDVVTVVPGPGPEVRRGRWASVVLSGGVGVVLIAVLTWNLLPGGGADEGSGAAGTAPSSATSGSAAVSPSSGSTPSAASAGDLLTPAGIRTALAAVEKKTGRSRYSMVVVYPEYLSAQVLVNGSSTSYDTYTYRVGQGVEEGIIKSQVMSGNQPLSLKGFDWDRLPALLTEARKKLNVAKPTNRYLILNPASSVFDTPASMSVYFTDDYGKTGYLKADPKGKVTEVTPADG